MGTHVGVQRCAQPNTENGNAGDHGLEKPNNRAGEVQRRAIAPNRTAKRTETDTRTDGFTETTERQDHNVVNHNSDEAGAAQSGKSPGRVDLKTRLADSGMGITPVAKRTIPGLDAAIETLGVSFSSPKSAGTFTKS